jgi:hypothetical protein
MKNKWKYNKKLNSIMYTGKEVQGQRNLWLADNVKDAPFLLSMVKAIVTILNKSNAELEYVPQRSYDPLKIRLKEK